MPNHNVAKATNRWRGRYSRLAWVAVGLGAVALCVAVRMVWGPGAATAGGPADDAKTAAREGLETAAPQKPEEKLQVVAVVNGEPISREELAHEALRHYGKEVLEALMNKHLIAEACARQKVDVTTEEVAAEIDRMAQRFGVATDQWLKMLKEERKIAPAQYAKDIIWPTIALRKLAAQRCEPTEQEIQQAYESQYGPAVRIRLIALDSLEKAKHIRALAVQNPDEFPELARHNSVDTNSAAVKGLVPPVRRHLGDPNIEQVAFRMTPGEISEPIPVGSQFVLMKCESHLPAVRVPWESVYAALKEACRDKKLRQEAAGLFESIKNDIVPENIFNDPVKSRKYPGVAAMINGKKITMAELAEECLERHGIDVLDGTINRRLIEQAVRGRNIVVTDQDFQAEVARAALAMGKLKADGSADVDAWIKHVIEEQKVTLDRYRYDIVWPSIALKKLIGERLDITREDIQRGYEANYGERVRCRAIVLNQHRKGNEVWAMARDVKTADKFGDLAEQYSVEANSRALRGEIPPIHRHSNQPEIEKVAFGMKPGEVSTPFQVDDKMIILFCEGRTQPNNVPLADVEKLIYEDVHEKKLRLAMAKEFTRLQDQSRVDNLLAHTTKAPKADKDRDALSQAAPRK